MASNETVYDNAVEKSLEYHEPQYTENVIYSVDLIKMKCTLTDHFMNEIHNTFHYIQRMSKRLVLKEKHRYDETYVFIYEARYGTKEKHMRVDIRHNPITNSSRCIIECNPNKCFSSPDCLYDIGLLLENSIDYNVCLMDIAMDIRAHIRDVIVKKDNRSMTQYWRKSSNKTIYLGKRGKVGNVRVYDKKEESNLPYDLTRVELKVGNPMGFNFLGLTRKHLPQVYLYKAETADTEVMNIKLSSTDIVLIKALRDHPNKLDLLNMLDRKKANKIKPYVLANYVKVEFDINIIKTVINNILVYLELEDSAVEGDKYIVLRNNSNEVEKYE